MGKISSSNENFYNSIKQYQKILMLFLEQQSVLKIQDFMNCAKSFLISD